MAEAVSVFVDLLIDSIQARLWLENEVEGLLQSAYELEADFKEKNRSMRKAQVYNSESAMKRSTNQEARLRWLSNVLEDVAGASGEEVVRKLETVNFGEVLSSSNVEQTVLVRGEVEIRSVEDGGTDGMERVEGRSSRSVATVLDLSMDEENDETGQWVEEDLGESTDAEGVEDVGSDVTLWGARIGLFLDTLKKADKPEDFKRVQQCVADLASSLASQGDGKSTLEAREAELMELSIQDVLLCMKEQNIDALPLINVVYRFMSSL